MDEQSDFSRHAPQANGIKPATLPARPEFQQPLEHGEKRIIVWGIIAGVTIALAGSAAGYWYLANRTFTAKVVTPAQIKQAGPYVGWKAYDDVGYAAASGISLKYPPDWHVKVGGKYASERSITNADGSVTVSIRSIDLSNPYATETPKQEWNTCFTAISGDACGANPSDKTITGSEATVNALATYSAKMKTTETPVYTYYVTVVRGSGLNPGGDGTPFVEFTMKAGNAANLAIFRQMMASVSFNSASSSADAYAGWKTYASSYEKLSFKYPSDWKITTSPDSTQVTGADSAVLTSPSGSVKVVWHSAVEGIGGACSVYILPGTTPKPDDLGPCPYWYVLNKQKLAGADLYFVDGVEELSDGKGYMPWCGLQAAGGIVQNESNIGYMLFQSKSNHFKGSGEQDLGPVQAEFACGNNFNGTIASTGTTKDQATAFLSKPEMQQAKLILLSASY